MICIKSVFSFLSASIKLIVETWFVLRLADVDECGQQSSCCQQNCANYPGGYECYCSAGYRLSSDGCSCDGMFKIPHVYEKEEIFHLSFSLLRSGNGHLDSRHNIYSTRTWNMIWLNLSPCNVGTVHDRYIDRYTVNPNELAGHKTFMRWVLRNLKCGVITIYTTRWVGRKVGWLVREESS